jgi:hypothetical protein
MQHCIYDILIDRKLLFVGGADSMVTGILAFSVVVILISAVISTRRCKMDRAEIATYIVLIAWGSLLFGLFLEKLAG